MSLDRILSSVVLAATVASTAWAQAPRVNPERAPDTPEDVVAAMAAREPYRPDVQILSSMVRALLPATKAAPEVKAEAEKLAADADPFVRAGNAGQARMRLSQALVLLLGRTWTPAEEYAASLALRTSMTVADSASPFIAQLAQRYPAPYQAKTSLRVRASLAEGGIPARADIVVPTGKIIREMGTFDLGVRDLNDTPFSFDLLLDGVPEGSYLVVADVLDGSDAVANLVTPVYLVRDLRARQAAIERGLATIRGHESAAATVRYPFDLARGLNTGNREVNHFDFGAEVRRSEVLLKQLLAGNDPLYQGKGDLRRNYYFAEAGEIMPYRIYVPSGWAPGKHVPMILALHGSQLDESNFITRADGRMTRLAEQYGWIVACPLGYRINGGYGNSGGMMVRPPRVAELSEKDAMNVLELVAAEYGVDRSRVYITGNSMGGGGTFHLAARYPEKFAAMAPCGSGMNVDTYPYDRVKGMPMLGVAGELDPRALNALQASVKAMQEHGLKPEMAEVKDGTHSTAVEIMMPRIFEFFAKYSKTGQ